MTVNCSKMSLKTQKPLKCRDQVKNGGKVNLILHPSINKQCTIFNAPKPGGQLVWKGLDYLG